MATIRARRQANGSIRYTAIVRKRVGKTIVHREAKTFTHRSAALTWRGTEKSSSGIPRRCTGLRYWTETVGPMGRLDCAIRKLRRKPADPGDDINDWDLEYFPKPKWMRCGTHERLVEKGLEVVARRDAVWIAGAARLLTRLGASPRNNLRT